MAVIRGTNSSKGSKPKPAPKVVTTSTAAKRITGATAANKRYGPGPISVYTKPNASPHTTSVAVSRWNKQAGFNVFKTTQKPRRADVTVRLKPNMGASSYATGGIFQKFKGGRPRGQVSISKPLKKAATSGPGYLRKDAVRAYQHELGHTVGLDHPGPKRNPYLKPSYAAKTQRRAKREAQVSRQSGIMGSGRRLNTSEVSAVRSLRRTVSAYRRLAAGKGRYKGR